MAQDASIGLRQRTTLRSDGPSGRFGGASSDETSHATGSSRRRSVRLNRVLGRIVPIILLVYIANAYDLVVLRYAYQHVYLQQGRIRPLALWLVPTHGLFLWSLRAYLRVFFAHSLSQSHRKYGEKQSFSSWVRQRIGAKLAEPTSTQTVIRLASISAAEGDVAVELCDANGEPTRCWRDACGGRIKAFRTRHCGDCGTCRVGFDHHCAWFDNDVTAPSTLRPFVGFLLSIPPLYSLGFAPLFVPAWRTLRDLAAAASKDAHIGEVWWSRWYSWLGGPALRWIVALSLASKRRSSCGPAETVRAPVIIALGGVFVLVASALAASSIVHLRRGLLTVDVERAKAFARLQHQKRKLEASSAATTPAMQTLQQDMDRLASSQHFRVSWTDPETGAARREVVVLSPEDGLMTHGLATDNLRAFLAPNPRGPVGWALSEAALRTLLTKASVPLHRQ